LDTDAKRARDRAEAAFKKKEQQLREGQQAMAEYEAGGRPRVKRPPELPSFDWSRMVTIYRLLLLMRLH
jgi:hypothetical protein